MIRFENNRNLYFDKKGKQLKDGDFIKFESGRIEKVYEYENDDEIGLGVDATNKDWLKSGRAYPTQYGIYPLTFAETEECEIIGDYDEPLYPKYKKKNIETTITLTFENKTREELMHDKTVEKLINDCIEFEITEKEI